MRAFRQWTGPRLGLLAILLLSAGLRFVLVARGGQFFWADESRFSTSVYACQKWEAGQRLAAVQVLIGSADHLGFKVQMLGPAWLQLHVDSDPRFPSAIISLFSVANIFWIWRIARRMGADEREAFWAAAAMASANSMFYWARHMMPYDVSLFWALACAAVALRPAPNAWHSLLAGFLGFVAFVTYNGYWATIACLLTAHVLLAWPNWWMALRRAALGLVSLGGSFFLLLVIARLLNIYLLPSYLDFAGSINQGDFGEGHLVFFDYLWRTEGLTALIWLAALLAFGWLVRSCTADIRRRGGLWIAFIVALTAILITGSNWLGAFVVYGRLVRQVVPFCALLTGWTAARVLGSGGGWRRGEWAALLLFIAGAAGSMATPLRMEFPTPFRLRALAVTTAYRKQHGAAEPAAVAPEKFRFLYDSFIWPYPAEKPLPPHYLVLLASPHPLAWRPYLYEGFSRAQRKRIEATDITMRLVLLQD